MSSVLATIAFVYFVSLPLWLPPVVIARRSSRITPLQRTVAFWLASLSPIAALVAALIVGQYCSSGSTATGIGEGALWPQCPEASIAVMVMLAPATLMGLSAWVLAMHRPRP